MRDYLIVVIEMIAKILAGIMILIYGFALVSLLEGGQKPLPFVLEGTPFGTHAQSTQLGMLTLGAGWVLSLVGAILSFWWARTAARILIAAGIVQTFLWGIWLVSRAQPTGSLWAHMIIMVLPPFVIAILLLITLRDPIQTQKLADGKAGINTLAP